MGLLGGANCSVRGFVSEMAQDGWHEGAMHVGTWASVGGSADTTQHSLIQHNAMQYNITEHNIA